MIDLKTKGRKDDIESLIYMICFMYSSTLPVIDYINQNLENLQMT